jgi:hypothetical protein
MILTGGEYTLAGLCGDFPSIGFVLNECQLVSWSHYIYLAICIHHDESAKAEHAGQSKERNAMQILQGSSKRRPTD